MIPRLRQVAFGGLVAAALAAGTAASALYGDSAAVPANTFVAAALAPAGNLASSTACAPAGGGFMITLGWTASPSTFVQGYAVDWADDVSGAPGSWNALGTTTATTMADPLVLRKSFRWYRVRATAWSWTSAEVVARVRAPARNC